MSKLTLSQQKMMNALKYSINVYVFDSGDGYTFSYYKDNTCARVYTTLTAKSLLKRGLCKIKLCDVSGSMGNCVGVLEILGEVEFE